MTDAELTALLKQGDGQAFEYLVKTYQDRIFNACLGVLHSAEDAEDMAQEVFMEVYRSVGGFKEEAKLSTWMYRIAMTKSLDHLRSKKRKKRFAFVSSLFSETSNNPRYDPPDFIHPGVQLENKETAAYLFKAIDALPENQKIAFTLHKIEGLSYNEIGEVMSLSLPSVESLMFRAKQNLKDLLGDYYKTNF